MSGRRCAFLTMEDTTGWNIDVDLGIPPLEALGWEVDSVPWRSSNPVWNEFDAVYIGAPWDYPEDPNRFLTLLASIDKSNAILVNDLSIVHWSMAKTYLRDLESNGAPIVPSLWYDGMASGTLGQAFDTFDAERIIIKPIVSTNATDTYLLTRESARDKQAALGNAFSKRPFVLQPFVESIQVDGEFSLFYFNRAFSHAIQKIPHPGDFRVQEEFGATIMPVDPEPALLAAGKRVIRMVDPMPAYGRVDFVRDSEDRYVVMELELIEPSMYLRTNPDAPRRFAEAFDQYVIDALAGDRK